MEHRSSKSNNAAQTYHGSSTILRRKECRQSDNSQHLQHPKYSKVRKLYASPIVFAAHILLDHWFSKSYSDIENHPGLCGSDDNNAIPRIALLPGTKGVF